MAKEALVGFTGFVGSNIHRQKPFSHLYNSKNIAEIRGQRFELLVFAATQAMKWWANLHPEEDWEGIEAALAPLGDVRADRVVLISTIDVLPPVRGADEDFDPHGHDNQPYGANRLRMEDSFQERFENTLVVRLPDLFGRGLKKNVVFDLLNDNLLEKINPQGLFQFYCLDHLWPHVELALEAGLEVVHLFPEPCTAGEVVERFFPGKAVGSDAGGRVVHDFRTRHSRLFGRDDGFVFGRGEVFEQLGRFVAGYRRDSA